MRPRAYTEAHTAGRKKATIDYEELFRSEPKKSEDDWFCGLSALMLDDDPSAPLKVLPSAAGAVAEAVLTAQQQQEGVCSTA